MKKLYLTAALMVTCLLGLGLSARAQDADAVIVNVPFEFVAGSTTLPAGEYRIGRINPDTNRELAIRSYDKGGAILLPMTYDVGTVEKPALDFQHVGGKYFLSAVKTLGGVYSMPASREMVMLGRKDTPNPSTLSASGSH